MILRVHSAALTFFCLLGTLSASAHVTVFPEELPAGGYAKLTFRVPHGCSGSPTIGLRVQIPEGVLAVKPQVNPGWTIEIVKEKLAKPLTDSHGKSIEEVVKEIRWTGGKLSDEHMDEFGISLKMPEKAGETLAFPIVQNCEQGVHRWIQLAKGNEHLKEPAPLVKLLPAKN